jgi:hypothetical protein
VVYATGIGFFDYAIRQPPDEFTRFMKHARTAHKRKDKAQPTRRSSVQIAANWEINEGWTGKRFGVREDLFVTPVLLDQKVSQCFLELLDAGCRGRQPSSSVSTALHLFP